MLKIILYLSLFAQNLISLPYTKNILLGYKYDTNKSQMGKKLCDEIKIVKIDKKNHIRKIKYIKNLNDLIKESNIEKTFDILNNITINKILDNPYINKYTITYMIYDEITIYTNKMTIPNMVKIKIDQNSQKSYINEIKYGSKLITLIHIKTNSQYQYNLIRRNLKKQYSWNDMETFLQHIKKYNDQNQVVVKNYIIGDNSILPIKNIIKIKKKIENFEQYVKKKPKPYDAILKPINNRKRNPINKYLKYIYIKNNLNYILIHKEEFKKTIDYNKLIELKKKILHIRKERNYINMKNSINIKYPDRYIYSMIDRPIKIEPITISDKTIIGKFNRLEYNTDLKVKYDFKLERKNGGNLIVLSWKKYVYKNGKTIQKLKNSKIILDSYVNFRGLKAQTIINTNFAQLSYKTKFDHFKKSKIIEGNGFIKKAKCRYEVDKKSNLKIYCNDIKIKDIKIKFIHRSDKKANGRRPTFPHQ